jgi:hypothetical protein
VVCENHACDCCHCGVNDHSVKYSGNVCNIVSFHDNDRQSDRQLAMCAGPCLRAAATPFLLSVTTIQPPSAGLLPICGMFISHCDPNQLTCACTTPSMHDLHRSRPLVRPARQACGCGQCPLGYGYCRLVSSYTSGVGKERLVALLCVMPETENTAGQDQPTEQMH